jgi:hypothetical protein
MERFLKLEANMEKMHINVQKLQAAGLLFLHCFHV